MWLRGILLVVFLAGLGGVRCSADDDSDVSSAFVEAAKSFFDNAEGLGGLQALVQSDAAKQVGEMLTGSGGKSSQDGIGQIISGIGNLMAGGREDQPNPAFSLLGTVLEGLASGGQQKQRGKRQVEEKEPGIDFQSLINMGSMFLGQNGNADMIMGLLPVMMENLGGKTNDGHDKHDHSGHSWFLPPVLENLHVMWDHFSNSELGQTLWKKSGLANIIGLLSDKDGNIQYQVILDSFENPTLRRRWIKSLTNFVAEWISHISDPAIQKRYLTTAQFVGNSFLKSQGFPKTAMFDSMRPSDSVSRLVNAVGKRYLGMRIDSIQYIKPAVAYIQELINLASEKGFVMSRINAHELSNRLSDTINNDIIGPILKAYRGYKWAVKAPHCASQILCSINEKNEVESKGLNLKRILTKGASFPAAWAISNKTGVSFWSLYGAILDRENCQLKYPAECTAFHEEEIRVTTEYTHSEL